ncbi:MAG: hypothetical protein ACK55Z_08480, partial [bacterium]
GLERRRGRVGGSDSGSCGISGSRVGGAIQPVAVAGRAAPVERDCLVGVHFLEVFVEIEIVEATAVMFCKRCWSVGGSMEVVYRRTYAARPG